MVAMLATQVFEALKIVLVEELDFDFPQSFKVIC